VARQVVRLAGGSAGSGHLRLEATAQPERLRAALAPLGLAWLAERTVGPAHQAAVQAGKSPNRVAGPRGTIESASR